MPEQYAVIARNLHSGKPEYVHEANTGHGAVWYCPDPEDALHFATVPHAEAMLAGLKERMPASATRADHAGAGAGDPHATQARHG